MRKHDSSCIVELLMLLAALVAFGLISTAFDVALKFLGVDTSSVTAMLVSEGIATLLCFGLSAVAVTALFREGTMRQALGLDFSPRSWRNALVAAAAILLCIPICDCLTTLNDSWHWSGSLQPLEEKLRALGQVSQSVLESFMNQQGVGYLLLNLLIVALIPGVCEELFFRGVIQKTLIRHKVNPHVAVWVTAVVFSLFHFDVFAFLPRFVLGALLGYLYLYSGSLLVNAAAHFVNNAAVVIVYYLFCGGAIQTDPSDLHFGWSLALICSIVAVVLLVANFGRGKTDENSIIDSRNE